MANSKKNRRRKTLSAVLIILAILIAGAAVGIKYLRQHVTENYGSKNSDEVQKATVTVGNIGTTITGSGTLSAQDTTVPTVPLAALEEDGTRTLVCTGYSEETDELLAPVAVETGLSDGTDVEILSSLSLGDTYYYRYAESLSYVTEE